MFGFSFWRKHQIIYLFSESETLFQIKGRYSSKWFRKIRNCSMSEEIHIESIHTQCILQNTRRIAIEDKLRIN